MNSADSTAMKMCVLCAVLILSGCATVPDSSVKTAIILPSQQPSQMDAFYASQQPGEEISCAKVVAGNRAQAESVALAKARVQHLTNAETEVSSITEITIDDETQRFSQQIQQNTTGNALDIEQTGGRLIAVEGQSYWCIRTSLRP